ncbi:mercuric reductase [uncultured Fibrella sp.]|uniref:mercuric reductase n=1 Tax=uncultured Fibrella sp. TaxID=1284596 RepID=UPI0035C9B45D
MNTNSVEHFDALIIGAGQAGKPLSAALAKKGWRTAMIERSYVGGTCINYGCTPTKTLIASAQMAFDARRAADYGVETGNVQVDFKAVIARKNQVVEQFRKGIEASFAKTENLTFIGGEARFVGRKQVAVSLNDGGERLLTADHIFIDCGTHPKKPDLPGLDTVPWLTSTALMNVPELPKHLLILGGGYIGVEFSQLFRRFGSEVTIIERGDQLLAHEDKDIVDELTKILTDEGVQVLTNTTVEQVSKTANGGVELSLETEQGPRQLTGSHLLVVTGTTPNTPTLDLETTGVTTDAHGFIHVDNKLETSQPGIYALGDIKGGPAFTHISYDDYRVINQNLLEGGNASIADRSVPYTVFTDPQLGRIGLSEQEARKAGRSIKVATMSMTSVARAIETDRTNGLMKVIIDADTDQLIGAAILGMEGGEIMSMLQIAMMGNVTYPRLRDAIFAHPTLAESLNNLFSKVA